MKREFFDKPFYTISNYLTSFFLSSAYFAMCNILLILLIIFTAISTTELNLFFLFIALIPLGPSIGALYSTIGKIVREKDMYFSSYYWSYYKNNFASFLKLWIIELITITLLLIDFKYFYVNMPQRGIHMIFAALIVIFFVIGFYAFSLNSRFELKLKDLFILSMYYTMKKFPITIIKVATISLMYYLSTHVSILLLIFMPSVICFIFFHYDKKIFKELEDKFLSDKQTNAA